MESPCRTKCCSKSTVRLLVLILVVVIYIICGALIFQTLERTGETKVFSSFQDSRLNFISKLNNCSLTEKDADEFVDKVLTAGWSGVFANENATYNEADWSFGRSVFFVITLLTTIGYGHMTPVSNTGKVFTIFYIMIGVPLLLVCFSAIVSRLMKPIGRGSAALKARLCLVKEFHADLLHLLLIFVALLFLFFIIPAAIFTNLEEWTYLDSLYFCFISLSTIGLGDLVPGESENLASQSLISIYFIGISCWLILGLLSVMIILAMIYNIRALDLNNCFTMDSDDSRDPERRKLTDDADLISTPTNSDHETSLEGNPR